jgi:hypothetical protein
LDLVENLDINKRFYISEYEGRFQIRPNWGVRYTFMPIQQEQVSNVRTRAGLGFWWGYLFYPENTPIYTKWHRNINRWDIVYDWFQARHAVSSIFAGYSLYDDLLSVATRLPAPVQLRARSRSFGLAHAGMSIDRIIRDFGCSGTTASCHCKFSLQFLEGYFGWDGSAMGRITVPMNCGRYGYLEAGWRWVVLGRDQPTDKDKTTLEGLTGAAGIVF